MKFWWSKEKEQSSWNGKIEVFSRHCCFSSISQHKKRFPGFSHEKCYRNLLDTFDATQANLTLFLDTAKGSKKEHFLADTPVIEISKGTESSAFLHLLDHIVQLPLDPDTILYLVEDDYLHRPRWLSILREGFTVPGIEYVTLYDHRDKYSSLYQKLQIKLFHTDSCHWRTTPSTTQTFACRFRTLLEDLEIHRKYSLGRSISLDHAKFLKLQRKGRVLISSVPGWSTHVEEGLSSPCVEWSSYQI